MNNVPSRFVFPSRGFHIVTSKVAEADFFLDRLTEKDGYLPEFEFYLSAFVSAARSVTFALQAVMSKYPGFREWYPSRQDRLAQSALARFFVTLRNHAQKVGTLPIQHKAFVIGDLFEAGYVFMPDEEIPNTPEGGVVELCHQYMREIVAVVAECYRDFDVYADPRTIFTERGLTALGWSIDDLEESLGFPRGWTDLGRNDPDDRANRLRALSRYGGDEELEQFIDKYCR